MPWFAHRRAAAIVVAACSLAACSHSDSPTASRTVAQTTPCTGGASVQLSVNQAARIDCSNGGMGFTVAGAGASYLIVPEFATATASNVGVPFTIGVPTAASAAIASYTLADARQTLTARAPSLLTPRLSLDGAALSALSGRVRPGQRQALFDRMLRGSARTQFAAGAQGMSAALRNRIAPSMAALRVTSAVAVGSLHTFRVRATFSATTPQWKSITARLAYAGSNVLLYVDTLAPGAPDGFTPSQLQSFGQYFDQTLYPIALNAFGPPSDVDQNGAVVMLMSPTVNSLTPSQDCASQGYVEGYFDEVDLGAIGSANSNGGEIFYSIVPDSLGTVSCAHTVGELLQSEPATFLHELQHLISFSQHAVVHGQAPQASWLDEGMSILAEELGSMYYEAKCPPPACRTNPQQIFPDSSQGFIDGFLYDSYEYLLRPDTASVTLHDDSEDGFSWRGGDWLLVHWLYDQKGVGVLKALEQNTASGIPSIEAAAGESFAGIFADMGLAAYTDSLPSLARNTAPARDRLATRNLRLMFNRLYQTSSGPDIPRAFPLPVTPLGAIPVAARMVPGTTLYYRLDTPANQATVSLEFVAGGGNALPATLKPQVAIYRLPPGQ